MNKVCRLELQKQTQIETESMKSTALTVTSLLAVRRASRESREGRPTSAITRPGEREVSSTPRPASASNALSRAAMSPAPVGPSAASLAQPMSAFSEVVSEDFLSCKMCYRGLVRARILRCLHTFCEECLRQRIRQINPLRAVIECTVCHTNTRVMNEGIGEPITRNELSLETITRLEVSSFLPLCVIKF